MTSKSTGVKRWFALAGVSVALAAMAWLLGGDAVAAGKQGKQDKDKQESHVKVTASAGKIDKNGSQTVTVTMEIESPWYAYANPVGNEDLESARTKVGVTAAKKLEKVEVNYPPGKRKMLGTETYNAYEGKVEITATVKRAPGDTGPLDVSVKYMTCNPKGICLPPEEVKLQVK